MENVLIIYKIRFNIYHFFITDLWKSLDCFQMAHVLNGERPQPMVDNNGQVGDQFEAGGQMEHLMVRQDQNNMDADELRRRHAENMAKKANAICTKSYNDPLVSIFYYHENF